jgi:hypothetical protein
MTFIANNTLRFTDLKKAFSGSSLRFVGDCKSYKVKTDWVIQDHGNYNILNQTILEGDSVEDYVLNKNAGKATAFNTCFNERTQGQLKETINNIYNKRYYTSTVAMFDNVKFIDTPFLGAKIVDVSTGIEYVLYSMEVTGAEDLQKLEIVAVRKP